MNYFISDLHFGANYRFDDEIRERRFHDSLICGKWNSTVTNADHVYVLGDIGRTGNNCEVEYAAQLFATLKGTKHLIVGNHDRIDDLRLKTQFAEIVDYKRLRFSECGKSYEVVLSHYPILFWENQHKGAIHLYGHVHNTIEDKLYQCALSEFVNPYFRSEREGGRTDCPEAIAINVGAMRPYMDYCPRAIHELLDMKGV